MFIECNVLLFWMFGDFRDRIHKLLVSGIAPSIKDIMRCYTCMQNIFAPEQSVICTLRENISSTPSIPNLLTFIFLNTDVSRRISVCR